MTKKNFSVDDVVVEDSRLLKRGYSNEELVGRAIVIIGVTEKMGDIGEYLEVEIEGVDKLWTTGAHNVVARLREAAKKGMFPLDCTVVKNGRSFDIK